MAPSLRQPGEGVTIADSQVKDARGIFVNAVDLALDPLNEFSLCVWKALL